MYALTWKETKPGARWEAEADGRWLQIRLIDKTYHWFVTYPGESEGKSGKSMSRRAAEQAAARAM